MVIYDNKVQELVREVAKNFRSLGGGKGSKFNPVAEALKEQPPQFAAGVDIEAVVRFVLSKA